MAKDINKMLAKHLATLTNEQRAKIGIKYCQYLEELVGMCRASIMEACDILMTVSEEAEKASKKFKKTVLNTKNNAKKRMKK